MNEENNNLNPNIENTVPSVENPDNTSQVGYEQPAVAETPVVETVGSTPQESYEAPVNTDAPVGLETPGAPTSQEVNETPVEPTTQMQDSNSQTESQSVATTQEPKKNNTLLFVIIGIVLLVAVAVGCFFMFGKKEDVNYENPTNKEETKQQIKYSDKVNFTSEIVEINSYYNKDKYLVANITNKNNVAVSYEINVELYDENNNLIKTEEEFLTHVEPNSNSTVAIELYDADDFATYKLFVDVTKEEYTKSQMKNIPD